MNSSNPTIAVWPVYSNQIYTILAHQKSLTVRIKRAGTPIYKHAIKEKELIQRKPGFAVQLLTINVFIIEQLILSSTRIQALIP